MHENVASRGRVFDLRFVCVFGFNPDRVPIAVGHRSDLIRTVFRAESGQFLGTIGMVSDQKWKGVRLDPERCPVWPGMSLPRSDAALEYLLIPAHYSFPSLWILKETKTVNQSVRND